MLYHGLYVFARIDSQEEEEPAAFTLAHFVSLPFKMILNETFRAKTYPALRVQVIVAFDFDRCRALQMIVLFTLMTVADRKFSCCFLQPEKHYGLGANLRVFLSSSYSVTTKELFVANGRFLKGPNGECFSFDRMLTTVLFVCP